MRKIKNYILLFILVCIILGIVLKIFFVSPKSTQTFVITMPSNKYIRNIDTNYYKSLLEGKLGVSLVFNIVPKTYSEEYLNKAFESSNINTDIYFSYESEEEAFLTTDQADILGKKGSIIPLNTYIDSSTHLSKIFNEFELYDLKKAMTARDGNIYYMPNLDSSILSRMPQTLWMNGDWLKNLKCEVPQNIDELYEVLKAFKEYDPNGNGIQDEIPLIGSIDRWEKQSANYIINSFVYNDVLNSRLFIKNNTVDFAPATDDWREAVIYLNKLYAEGLLPEIDYKLSSSQLTELASSPDDLVGAFTSSSITDVILSSCSDIFSKYIQITPIKAFDNQPNTVVRTPMPKVGAVITSKCKDPKKAFELLDFMMSEEMFLTAWYGEKGVDWEYAQRTDVDNYGNKASIKVLIQLKNKLQNKNFSGIGPLYTYPYYADSVTWKGYDPEYINARAYSIYNPYEPEEYLSAIILSGERADSLSEIRRNLDKFIQISLEEFICGIKDVHNDTHWNNYIDEINRLGAKELVKQAQSCYDNTMN